MSIRYTLVHTPSPGKLCDLWSIYKQRWWFLPKKHWRTYIDKHSACRAAVDDALVKHKCRFTRQPTPDLMIGVRPKLF